MLSNLGMELCDYFMLFKHAMRNKTGPSSPTVGQSGLRTPDLFLSFFFLFFGVGEGVCREVKLTK